MTMRRTDGRSDLGFGRNMSCADLSAEDIQETELVGYLAAQEGVTGAEVPIESNSESSELFRTDTQVISRGCQIRRQYVERHVRRRRRRVRRHDHPGR